jgi:hypothetical protein
MAEKRASIVPTGLATVVFIAVGLWQPLPPLGNWLVMLAALIAFTILVGQAVTRRWQGVLIDERNTISLSRLQLLLWSVVVLSAYLAAALARIRQGVADPLAIAVPDTLWMLLGISTASLVGSPLVKSTKTTRAVDEGQKDQTFEKLARLGAGTEKLDTIGQIVTNKDAGDARWTDLFRGEETGNAAQLDLGKVQMFFFTLVLVLAYGVALGRGLAGGPLAEFPDIAPGMVALLGISHAGYLTHKAVPHSK